MKSKAMLFKILRMRKTNLTMNILKASSNNSVFAMYLQRTLVSSVTFSLELFADVFEKCNLEIFLFVCAGVT